MKRIPEKMVMAAIIISCGIVAQAESPGQRTKAKQSTGVGAGISRAGRAEQALAQPARYAKFVTGALFAPRVNSERTRLAGP